MTQTEQVIQDIKQELWKLRAEKQREELCSAFYSSGHKKVTYTSRGGTTFEDLLLPGRSGSSDLALTRTLADQIKELENRLFLLQHPEVVEERARFAELEQKSVERWMVKQLELPLVEKSQDA